MVDLSSMVKDIEKNSCISVTFFTTNDAVILLVAGLVR